MRGEVEGHADALRAGGGALTVEVVRFLGGGKPAYWRIVHGRTAYMVACGPAQEGREAGQRVGMRRAGRVGRGVG